MGWAGQFLNYTISQRPICLKYSRFVRRSQLHTGDINVGVTSTSTLIILLTTSTSVIVLQSVEIF